MKRRLLPTYFSWFPLKGLRDILGFLPPASAPRTVTFGSMTVYRAFNTHRLPCHVALSAGILRYTPGVM